MLFCRLLTYFKIYFFKKIFKEHCHTVCPDLVSNFLQRFSADDKKLVISKKDLMTKYIPAYLLKTLMPRLENCNHAQLTLALNFLWS